MIFPWKTVLILYNGGNKTPQSREYQYFSRDIKSSEGGIAMVEKKKKQKSKEEELCKEDCVKNTVEREKNLQK